MKKFMVALVVFAITCFSVTAFAADVSVGGSYEIRSRDFNGLNMYKDAPASASGDQRDTQTRIRIDLNAKASDVLKGKLQLESDFGTGASDWGTSGNGLSTLGFETYSKSGASMGFREAWVLFQLPGLPVVVKGGHQLLQLGNGWFFRSQHYGSDAWVVFSEMGKNYLGFVNVKVSEGASVASADDADAYVILDTYKINDNNKVGFDFTMLKDRRDSLGFASAGNSTDMQNLGLNYNGKLGPVALKAQLDFQMGKAKAAGLVTAGQDAKFKGNQIVLEGSMPMDALTINFWLARGSGYKANDADYKNMVTFLDIDPHYTFLYEYKINTAAGLKNTGFANTTALGLGAMFAASKNLSVGGNLWYLKATEKTNVAGNFGTNFAYGAPDDAIGYEIDLMLNWKLYDNLTWNWVAGYFAPGDVYKGTYTPTGQEAGTEATTGIQGILSYKF